jgi:hypothetical protein
MAWDAPDHKNCGAITYTKVDIAYVFCLCEILLGKNTVKPQYSVDFGDSLKSMLYQNLCYIKVLFI